MSFKPVRLIVRSASLMLYQFDWDPEVTGTLFCVLTVDDRYPTILLWLLVKKRSVILVQEVLNGDESFPNLIA